MVSQAVTGSNPPRTSSGPLRPLFGDVRRDGFEHPQRRGGPRGDANLGGKGGVA